MMSVPKTRIRLLNHAPVDPQGAFVLYWMTANRRTTWNFSLERSIEWARELNRPLVVLEALRAGYRWASDRLHFFVIQGMAENASRLRRRAVFYYPYVEVRTGEGRGLLAELARRACVVVGDDYPCFFLPRMLEAAARQVSRRLEVIDSNGLLPMRAADKVFARAVDFRRYLQKTLRPHLAEFPDPDPLAQVRLPTLDRLPAAITRKWPAAAVEQLAADPQQMRRFPIDHSVPAAPLPGGTRAAEERLRHFLDSNLEAYGARNHPDEDASSGLSPYLHFGHIAAHQVFAETMSHIRWSPVRLGKDATGCAHGWWGASEPVEAFLDQLVTWRELGFNMCSRRDDYDRYESLPDWARRTLANHRQDPREHLYTLDRFEAADTHDELWNAAQRQLLREGRIHNYLRMLWGKKILEWTKSPAAALAIMIELNNKYALDGRDPNSYSGIFWVLGRYDRPWGPERPVFGKIRYMSSDNTARKLRVKGYIQQYAR